MYIKYSKLYIHIYEKVNWIKKGNDRQVLHCR